MTQFIHPTNQTLLWEIIQKSPLIQLLADEERPIWFKYIVQSIYQQSSTLPPIQSAKDLTQWNKYAIQQMLADLNGGKRNVYGGSISGSILCQRGGQHISPPRNPEMEEGMGSIAPLKKELNESNLSLFDKKQREFDDIFKNNAPPIIDFRMKETDEPIGDIEQLVKNHLKEREEELHKYTPHIPPDGGNGEKSGVSLIIPTTLPTLPTPPTPPTPPTINELQLKIESIENKIDAILGLLNSRPKPDKNI
jgi:hypothetical protein